MKKQHGTGAKELPAGQITPQELALLVRTANDGAWRVAYFAKWRTDDRARRDSLYDETVLDDLDEIEDFAGLRYLTLDYYYDREDWHDSLELSFLSGRLSLRWSGTIALEKARRVEDAWKALPKRAKLSDRRIMALTGGLYAVLLPITIYNLTRPSTWLTISGFALVLCALALTYGRNRLFVAPRAADQPFILSRPASAFKQPGFLVMLCLTSASLAVAAASFIRDLVAG